DILPQIFNGVYPPLPSASNTPIADVGCGQGAWLAWAASQGGENLTGIDISRNELDLARRLPNIRFIHDDTIVALKKQEEQFGLIHAKDLFEHLTKDEAIEFLQACHGALKPNGQLWIYTFNAQGWFAGATQHGDFTHELSVTPASLAQVLRAAGFTVVSVQGRLPAPKTLGGLGRRLLFRFLEIIGRFIIAARHGQRVSDDNVDFSTTLPDLLAIAKRETD
ncbi:MAG: class I SAM-dependent methyltransferase, partial [Verrucomicrobia bacterium]|nr:class I SAM-dependent methyltransferase [Verrucomicrobiota bacterium]